MVCRGFIAGVGDSGCGDGGVLRVQGDLREDLEMVGAKRVMKGGGCCAEGGGGSCSVCTRWWKGTSCRTSLTSARVFAMSDWVERSVVLAW